MPNLNSQNVKIFSNYYEAIYETQTQTSFIFKSFKLYCTLCVIAFLSPNFLIIKFEGCNRGGVVGFDFKFFIKNSDLKENPNSKA